jgi:dipeptidyl aminopeptidase/acylaminoacyl peptidase
MGRLVAALTLALIGTTAAAREGLKQFTFETLSENKALELEQPSNLLWSPDGACVSYWTSRDTEKLTWGRSEPVLDRPQDNPKGYRTSAPLTYTENSTCTLLLVHRAVDNNVQDHESPQLVGNFAAADKAFRLVVDPRTPRGVPRSHFDFHLRRLKIEFFGQYLHDELGAI